MLPRSVLLNYGDPVVFERTFGPARFFMNVLTGLNSAGHRHMRSDYFSRRSMRLERGHGEDIWSYEFGTPAVLIAWSNGTPDALRVNR